MSEQIRCSMCGKLNPADAEVCRYCHARLKPIQPGEIPQPKPTGALEAMLPPWIRELRNESETESTPPEENLLSLAQGTAPEAPVNTPVEEAAPSGSAVEESSTLWAEDNEDENENLPDWLKSLGDEAVPDLPSAPEEETLPSQTPSPAEPVKVEVAPEEEASLPDWLSAHQPPREGKEEAETAPAEEEILPDWLTDERALTEPPAAETASAEEDALPEWLGQRKGPSEFAEVPAKPASPPPFVESDELAETLLNKVPDWLQGLAPEEEKGSTLTETPTGAEPTEALAEGELPFWLEAMRPIDPSLLEEPLADEPLETQGPLAGLRGVITPPTPAASPSTKVGAWGGRLKLTDEHEHQVRILQDLVAEEFRSSPPPPPASHKEQTILRWSVGVLMLVAVFLPFVLPFLQISPPRSILPAAATARRLLDTVPQGAPVLVAVDYSPAFSAEMETTAAPLITDLLARQTRLVAISTQPTGPDLIVHLFGSLNKGYREGHQYLSLGYLPGGTAGLYTFARSPRLVFSHAAGHNHIWETSFLTNIHTAADFALVLVLTEDPETARAWIEQVRPVLGNHTPLLMAISAQAEPLVEPYYETASHQIGGIVTGMAGSMAYAALRGHAPSAKLQTAWSGYSAIIFLAVVIIAGAGLVNLLLGWREHRNNVLTLPDDEDLDDEET